MSLSPNDIRNYSFPNQMRGYDRDEVDSFKDQVAQALETQKQETLKLQMELDSVKSQLAGLKQFEDTIKGAAIDARRNADTLLQNAKKEAELILSRAKEEAEKLIDNKTKQCGHLDSQIEKLDLAKKSYLNKLKQLIGSHFELLDEIASTSPPERPSVPQPQSQPQSAPAAAQSEEPQLEQPAPPPAPKPENGIEVTESSEMRETERETVATQPKTQHGIKTEEANAADEIVPVEEVEDAQQLRDEEPDLTNSLRQVVKDEQADQPPAAPTAESESAAEETPEPSPQKAAEEGVIDPELAAALEKYQHMNPTAQPSPDAAESQEPNAIGDAPKQGEVIETQASADEPDKDFVPVAEAPESDNSDDDAKDENAPMDPNDLASTLDSVAKKFEEEMDRADKPQQ